MSLNNTSSLERHNEPTPLPFADAFLSKSRQELKYVTFDRGPTLEHNFQENRNLQYKMYKEYK